MSRLDGIFQKPGHKALIGYVTAGYPDVEATIKTVPGLVAAGCDAIELGIPFSDPLADGATIQRASYGALENGVTPELCLDMAGRLSCQVAAPLVFMSYLNPLISYGFEDFCAGCQKNGVSGLIIPDLPPEEGTALGDCAAGYGVDLIYLAAPTSSPERLRLVGGASRGFIYAVSLTGVTGARSELAAGLEDFVGRIRRETARPVCVGFGIATPEQAARVAAMADGVIIGSRIVQLMEEDPSGGAAARLVAGVRQAMDGLCP